MIDLFESQKLDRQKEDTAISVFSNAIYQVAKNDGRVGMEAMASTILNRCKKLNCPKNSTRTENIVKVCTEFKYVKLDAPELKSKRYKMAKTIASLAVRGALVDSVQGQCIYHKDTLSAKWPFKISRW